MIFTLGLSVYGVLRVSVEARDSEGTAYCPQLLSQLSADGLNVAGEDD